MAEQLDLHTVGDLLHHYPRRYAERGELTRSPNCRWTSTSRSSPGSPTPAYTRSTGAAARRLEVNVTDGSGRLQLVFFGKGVHKPHKELLPGTPRDVRGQGRRLQPKLQLAHPTYELLDEDDGDGGRRGRRPSAR